MEEQIRHFFFNPTGTKIIVIVMGVAIIWFVVSALQKSIFQRIKENENRYKAKKLSTFVGYLLAIILIMIVFSDKFEGFTVALGVAGAGIAFALQEVIASFAGWLTIMFGGFYKTGDRVQLGGIKGDVMDIGVLRTTVMETGQWVDGDLYNGRIVLVANSFVFKEPVFNYSGDFPFLWDEIKIPVQFGSDYDKTTELLLSIGKAVAGDLTERSEARWQGLRNRYRLEEAQTDPMVSLTANDKWVEFTLRYIVGYRKRRATKTALFTAILKAIEASEGKIRFASSTVQLVTTPGIEMGEKKDDTLYQK